MNSNKNLYKWSYQSFPFYFDMKDIMGEFMPIGKDSGNSTQLMVTFKNSNNSIETPTFDLNQQIFDEEFQYLHPESPITIINNDSNAVSTITPTNYPTKSSDNDCKLIKIHQSNSNSSKQSHSTNETRTIKRISNTRDAVL